MEDEIWGNMKSFNQLIYLKHGLITSLMFSSISTPNAHD